MTTVLFIRENSDKHALPNEVGKQIDVLNSNKANSGKVPTDKLKKAKDLACPYLTDCINSAIYDSEFPKELKDADVSPGFKKGVTTTKVNYRPISVLPSVSKISERILKGQMEGFLKRILSSLLSGFREGYRTGYRTQHSLVRVIEAWRRSLDSSGIVGTILMDLSKAYDCIPHDLIIAKLEAYGFNEKSLRLMYSYLTNRKQRVKIGSYESSQSNVKISVRQGSVLGPLLFNIFLNDLFYKDKAQILTGSQNTRKNHPTLRLSANGIAASSPLRRNQSFEVKFLVPSQKLKWMLKYCSYLKYFLINQL